MQISITSVEQMRRSIQEYLMSMEITVACFIAFLKFAKEIKINRTEDAELYNSMLHVLW